MSHSTTPDVQAPLGSSPTEPFRLPQTLQFLPWASIALLVVGLFVFLSTTSPGWKQFSGKLMLPLGNFGLFLYGLLYFVMPQLKTHLETRQKDIAEGIVTFSERDDAITQKYKSVQEKLEGIEQEKSAILANATRSAEQEKTELQEQVDLKMQRRLRETEQQLKQEALQVKQSFQKKLLEESFSEAQKLLHANIKEDDQVRLQKEYLQQISA